MIQIPKPMRYHDYSLAADPFFRVIPMDAWVQLSCGADMQWYRPVTHEQVYAPGRYDLPTLGTWSGDYCYEDTYLDSAEHPSDCFCLPCCDDWAHPF